MALNRVLIVEDTMDVGRYYQDTLRAAYRGLQITLVPSAEEAMLEASRTSFDLLITDIRLPGISGFDLARKIRPRLPEIKIMMVTGLKVDSFLEKQTHDLNIDLLLSKPLGVMEFLEGVEKLTGARSALTTNGAPKAEPAQARAAEEAGTQPRQRIDTAALAAAAGRTMPLTRRVGEEAPTLAALLAELRASLNAQAAIVVDAQGGEIDRSGEWPAPDLAARLTPDILAALAAFGKVSGHLRKGGASGAHALHGDGFDLAFSGVNGAAVLVFLRGSSGALRLALAFEHLLTLRDRIATLLEARRAEEKPAPAPVPAPIPAAPAVEPPPAVVTAKPALPDDAAGLDALAAIFGKPGALPAAQDADDFWDRAVDKRPDAPRADGALSYDQAREMGLLPGETDAAKPD